MPYNLILADDHALFRAGLKMILAQDPSLRIVAETASGKETVDALRNAGERIDLVVMDINMPDLDGIEATEAIRRFDRDVKLLIVTMYGDEAYVKAALKAGANGYVIKQAIDEELMTAVKTVLKGQNYIYPTLAAQIIAPAVADDKAPSSAEVVLSSREREVLRYLALGYTQREIGEQLFISEKTVETYKSRLVAKLGVEKRSDLVRYAFEQGIAEL